MKILFVHHPNQNSTELIDSYTLKSGNQAESTICFNVGIFPFDDGTSKDFNRLEDGSFSMGLKGDLVSSSTLAQHIYASQKAKVRICSLVKEFNFDLVVFCHPSLIFAITDSYVFDLMFSEFSVFLSDWKKLEKYFDFEKFYISEIADTLSSSGDVDILKGKIWYQLIGSV